MMKKKLVQLFAVVSVIICSCKNENIVNTPTQNPVYLTKVVDTGFIAGSAIPTYITSINYTYDSLNRLKSFYFASTTTGIPENHAAGVEYFYNGTDSLPFKAFNADNIILFIGDITEYYTYDALGRISKYTSTLGVSGTTSKNEYTYNANQIIVKHFEDTTQSSASFDTLAYDGNNITQDIATDTSIAHAQRTVFDMQFSNVQNPFNLVNINRHKPYRPSVYIGRTVVYEPGVGLGQLFLNKNAVASTSVNGQTSTQHFQYDVASGLPAKVVVSNNTAYFHTMYFYYR